MANDLTTQRKNDLELCDAMLEQTSSFLPKLLCKKAEWSMNGEDVPLGKEYIAYPMDSLHGVCRWEDGHIVEQHTGRIADKAVVLKVDKDQFIFNKKAYAKPTTGRCSMQCRSKIQRQGKSFRLYRALSAARSQ